ncbi:MAG: TIM barrel protein [Patescibacteria group bacterium]
MLQKPPIAIITDEVYADLDSQIKWMLANKINVGQVRTVNGVNVQNMTTEQAKAAAKAFKDAGIKIDVLAAGLGKTNLADRMQVEAQLDAANRLVDHAATFDCNKIRVFAGFRHKDIQAGWKSEVLPFFQELLEFFPTDIKLLVENEPATYCPTPMEVLALCGELQDHRVKLLIDIGNLGFAPELYNNIGLIGGNFAFLVSNMTEICQAIIDGVHVKNTVTNSSLMSSTVPLNAGIINFHQHVQHLICCGINRPICLEPHRLPKTDNRIVLDEAMRAMPGGPGYGNPEAAEEDLKILREILEKVEI